MRIRLGMGALALAASTLVLPTLAHADDARLGVSLQPLDDALREALDLGDTDGVLVSDVEADSPAEAAGLRDGDVIVEIEGRAATSARRVVRTIERADPGDEIELVIWRDGERRTVRATLDERDDDLRDFGTHRGPRGLRHLEHLPRVDVAPFAELFGRPRLGVQTRALDADLAAYFGVGANEGVLVLEVMKDTPAEEAGLKTGDVILRVDGESIDSPGDLRDLLLDHEGEHVTLDVKRQKKDLTIEAELDAPRGGLYDLGRGRASVFTIPDEATADLRDELDALRERIRALEEELRELKR